MEHDVRPWGEYWVLEDAEIHKIKRIQVNPGGRLSLQNTFHYHNWNLNFMVCRDIFYYLN